MDDRQADFTQNCFPYQIHSKTCMLANTLQIVKVLVPIEVGADGEAPIYEDDGAKNEDMEMSSLSSSENPSTLANMNIGYLNNILKMIFY